VCTSFGDQHSPAIVESSNSSVIVAWEDDRNGSVDIYAQLVQANGQLGGGGLVSVVDWGSRELALEPMTPNPRRNGAMRVHFTLEDSAPARLELLDVTGRRVASTEVGSLGAGRHSSNLGQGRRLAPGLYLIRLRQGTATRMARVAVLE
jgi:hypothetical protein